jgi:hypothetical protein
LAAWAESKLKKCEMIRVGNVAPVISLRVIVRSAQSESVNNGNHCSTPKTTTSRPNMIGNIAVRRNADTHTAMVGTVSVETREVRKRPIPKNRIQSWTGAT